MIPTCSTRNCFKVLLVCPPAPCFRALICPSAAPSSSPRPETSFHHRKSQQQPRKPAASCFLLHPSLISTDTLAPLAWLSTRALGGLWEPYSAWSSPHSAPQWCFLAAPPKCYPTYLYGPHVPLRCFDVPCWRALIRSIPSTTVYRYPPCTEPLPLARLQGPVTTMRHAQCH